MSDNDVRELGPAEVQDRATLLKGGKGFYEDARLLIALFCLRAQELTFPASPISEPLRNYIVEAFTRYLQGEAKTLDHAFGLVRRGRRATRAILERNERIAIDVAERMRVDGETLEQAAFAVSEEYGLHESDVKNIYAEHKDGAVQVAEILRRLDSQTG